MRWRGAAKEKKNLDTNCKADRAADLENVFITPLGGRGKERFHAHGPSVPRPGWYHGSDNVRITASNRSRPIFEGGRRLTFRKCFFSSLPRRRCVPAGLLSSSFGKKKKRSDVPVKVASWLLRIAVTPPPTPAIFPNLPLPPTSSLRSVSYPVLRASVSHPSPISRTRFLCGANFPENPCGHSFLAIFLESGKVIRALRLGRLTC